MSNKRKSTTTNRAVTAVGAIAALAVIAGISGSVMASDEGRSGRQKAAEEIAGSGQHLSMEQIVARVKEQGFGDVYEVEREHGAYEVKAHNPQGNMVKLYVDPRTGGVLRHKLDD